MLLSVAIRHFFCMWELVSFAVEKQPTPPCYQICYHILGGGREGAIRFAITGEIGEKRGGTVPQTRPETRESGAVRGVTRRGREPAPFGVNGPILGAFGGVHRDGLPKTTETGLTDFGAGERGVAPFGATPRPHRTAMRREGIFEYGLLFLKRRFGRFCGASCFKTAQIGAKIAW